MPTENNTGLTWTFEDVSYFLRDDEAAGICDYERYSLFRFEEPDQVRHIRRATPSYGRVGIWGGSLSRGTHFFHNAVQQDRFNRGFDYIDPTTVFLDERGQP